MSYRDATVRPMLLDASQPALQTSPSRLVGLVLLPFVTGYFLSYFFRTVNAVLATRLSADLSLTAVELGVMTAAYFLMAALAQLPLGWALDHFGPRRVQVVCLVVAAAGAALFSRALDIQSLFVARALIGLGVASALLAGLKAMAMVCAPARLGLFNGVYMCLGAFGAVAASIPTEHLLQSLHWRDLFIALALACLAAAALIALLVPRLSTGIPTAAAQRPALGYCDIFQDRYFWRLAPLSATAIGAAWALQGLWSAPWLRDVAHLTPPEIAQHLLIMAISLSLGALSFGVILQFLSRRGISPAWSMMVAALAFITAELGLALSWPIPPLVAWCLVSAFAAATVMTYTMSAQHFPKESVGRANSAFNLLHFLTAFSVQSLFGTIVAQWPRTALGHYPPEAYKAALLGLAAVQLVALAWFLRPEREDRTDNRLFTGAWHKMARSVVWLMLLWVGAQAASPYKATVGEALLTWAGTHHAEKLPVTAEHRVETLEVYVASLERRLAESERQLQAIGSNLAHVSATVSATHGKVEQLDEAITNLNEGVGELVDQIERQGR